MTTQATAFRARGDKLTEQIKKKMNPATASQNHTPRRARIIAGMYEDAVRLTKIQRVLYGLADSHITNRVPLRLSKVTKRTEIEALIFNASFNRTPELFDMMTNIGAFTQGIFEDAKLEVLTFVNEDDFERERRRRELADKEKSLIGQAPGYFPTPPKVGETLLDHIDFEDDAIICDPFAGGGAILDVIKNYHPGVKTVGTEINHTLAEIAAMKGHQVTQGDTYQAQGRYKYIVTNPPFEDSGDIEGVLFAYDNLLEDGGTLVSVCGNGCMNNTSKKAVAFQEFVAANGYYEDLPAGSFKPSGTGVSTLIVVLKK